MKSILILFIFFICFQNNNSAQALSVDTISYGKHNDTYYFYKGKKLNESKLKPFLIQYNSSEIEYKKYSNYSTPGTIILLIGMVAGVIELTKLKDDKFWNPYSATLYGSLAVGIPLRYISFKYLKRSVKAYNREIIQ